MKHTILLLTLILAIGFSQAQAIWDGTKDTRWFDNDPTAKSYAISTAEELAGLAELVNNGESFEAKTINLAANILLNDTTNWKNWETDYDGLNMWTPIGLLSANERPFKGSFDGKGYVVAGIYINYGSLRSHIHIGLFGYVNGSVTFRNVGIKASYIKAYSSNSTIGSLVGYFSSYNGTDEDISISNCYNEGTVYASGTNNSSVGGLIGSAYCYIDNCHNIGKVYGAVGAVGGLIGIIQGKMTNCYNTNSISGGGNMGGLAGYNGALVEKCYNLGDVTGTNYIGGLFGRNEEVVIDCYNTGNLNGTEYMGGLAGYNRALVEKCYNLGDVTGTKNYIGGLCGSNNAKIMNSYNKGKVNGIDYVGGLAGEDYSGDSICNCINYAEVNGRHRVGGLFGGVQSSNSTINSCRNLASVNGTGNLVGGLIGWNKGLGTIINNSANFGNVTGSNYQNGQLTGTDYIGGIIGYNDIEGSIYISNTYNTGDVSGSNYVGGLGGYNETTTIINCYNAGAVTGQTKTGGLIGEKIGGIVTYSYWRIDGEGGITEGAGAGSFSTGAGGKTTAELQSTDFIALLNNRAKAMNNEGAEKPYYFWTSDAENSNKGFAIYAEASVNFDKNGDDATEATPNFTLTTKGSTIALPTTNPTREGFIFKGWRMNAESTGDEFTASTLINGHITVFAFWQKILTVSGSTIEKVYDGNPNMQSGYYIQDQQLQGVIENHNVYIGSTTAQFADKNAGVNKTVTYTYTLEGDDSWRYVIYPETSNTGTITPLTLAHNIIALSKIYDGKAEAEYEGGLNNVIDGDDVTLNVKFRFANGANAQYGEVEATEWKITGTDAGNYTLPEYQTQYASIEAAPQSIAFTPETNLDIDDGTYTLSASADSGLPVLFRIRSNDTEFASIDVNVLTLLKIGEIEVTAYVEPNENYAHAQEVNVLISISGTTGIGNGTQLDIPLAIKVDGGIKVSGLTPGEILSIYTPQGVMVYRQTVTESIETISIISHGIYIITIGNYKLRVVY